MSSHVPPVSLSDELFDVQQRMVNERIAALPVMENARFLGMITWQNIEQALRALTTKPGRIASAH